MPGLSRFRSIVVDTLNQLQIDQLMRESKKPNYDDWADYGKEIMNTIGYAKQLNPSDIYIILVLGKEGTGKTIGVKGLNAKETYYVNADKKPLSFPGWRKDYVKGKISEGGNYTDSIDNYEDIRNAITAVYNNRIGEPFFIFFLAHVEDYKTVNGLVAQKLKTLGKVASKQNIEGSVIHTYYTDIDTNKTMTDSSRYRFRVVTTGSDTARSPMGYYEDAYIPNNLQLIIDKVIEMEY